MANAKIDELEAQLKAEKAKQLFVTFYSPGTFFCEQSSFEVENGERDLAGAAALGKSDVKERYNARPFGFRFTDGNGKILSGMHYLTGKVLTRDDVPDDKEHSIMRSNMEDPDRCICVENTNSFSFRGEFREEDFIIDWDGTILRRGDEPDLVAYRAEMQKRYDEKYGS